MEWNPLASPTPQSWFSEPLTRECARIEKDIRALEKLRTAADSEEQRLSAASRADRDAADARPYCTATIAALEKELTIRDAIEICGFAQQKLVSLRRREVETELHELELAERNRLGLPDETAVPLCCLQIKPEWWSCRRRLYEIGDATIGYSAAREEIPAALQQQLRELRTRHAGEEQRLAAVAEECRLRAEALAAQESHVDEREAERQVRRDRVSSLLA